MEVLELGSSATSASHLSSPDPPDVRSAGREEVLRFRRQYCFRLSPGSRVSTGCRRRLVVSQLWIRRYAVHTVQPKALT